VNLFEEIESVEMSNGHPVLMEIQQRLLDRGRSVYSREIRRAIWQAPCGSGKTIVAAKQTHLATSMSKRVLHIVHRRRLVDQMLAALMKFGIRAAPIMEGRMRWDAPVSCASRDTLLAMLKSGGTLPLADLIIWDECHVAANMLQKWYLENAKDSYWTGYTATPVLPDGGSLNPPYQALVSMAPTSEMLRLKRLCPVKVYNPDSVGRRRRNGDKVKPVGDPVDHWKKYANDLPTVAYAASVADSQALVQRYNTAGITAEHMDASTEESERDAIFDRSECGQTKVISNCGVLIEGVDLPWLVCCQILRGCNSLVLWMQACGRIMRWLEGKPNGIVLDHSGAAHEFGLPDADFEWSLGTESQNVKKNKPPNEGRPVTCLKCGLVFAHKPACPECGHVLPKKQRKSLVDSIKPGEGILTEFNGAQAVHISRELLDRLFRKCYYIAKARGRTMRSVSAMFSKEAGMPPWQADLSVNVPKYDEWGIPAKEWEL